MVSLGLVSWCLVVWYVVRVVVGVFACCCWLALVDWWLLMVAYFGDVNSVVLILFIYLN